MSSIYVSAHAANSLVAKSNATVSLVPLLRVSQQSFISRFSSSRRRHRYFLAVNSGCTYFLSSPCYQYGRDSKSLPLIVSKCSETERSDDLEEEDEWLSRLPEKNKALYSHSLPCIEAWLRRRLGFYQSEEDRAVWFAQKPEWHAQLSLDITDLHIRYFKSGPGNLEKDVERRFSYALSREDIENAVLGGP